MSRRVADARARLGQALTDDLPDVDVSAFPVTPEQLIRPRIVLAVRRVEPADTACPYERVELDVWTIAATTDPGPADDDVDDLLDVTLSALDARGIRWTAAERGVWADTQPCYRVAVEMETT